MSLAAAFTGLINSEDSLVSRWERSMSMPPQYIGAVVSCGVSVEQQSRPTAWQKPCQTRTFQDSASQRVDHRHRATAQHLDQADHAEPGIGAQIERVHEVGVRRGATPRRRV